MSHLAIALFGGFRAELDGQPITAFGTDKNRALLAYLAIESKHPHRREALAPLLWPDHPEVTARNSLRQALHQLRHIFSQGSGPEPYLLITSEQVQFNSASDHWIDVTEFKSRLSASQSHHPTGSNLCAGCLKSLQRAIELYQGEMLAGLTLPRCTRFTEWQIFTQEACHTQVLSALFHLANYFEANHAYDQLIACAQRKIELEPWRESAHRRLMWALAKDGQRPQALRQYETLREVLQRELGILPTDKTRYLYEQIRGGYLLGLHAPQAEFYRSFPQGYPLPENAPSTFVARQSELAQLHRFLRDSLEEQGRVAFVSGEAGSGKTALLNEFARQSIETYDDLLVVGGTCSAYLGLGDPCQPFREVLQMLAGITAAPHAGGMVSPEQVWRLNAALPVLLRTVLEVSPGLTDTLLPAQELLPRARAAAGLDAATLARLKALVAPSNSAAHAAAHPDSQMASPASGSSFIIQADLFDQVAQLLLAISQRFPLLILLDDLQWSDSASASLLFYLGGHLSGGRILLLGAYRPEDIATTGELQRHPLVAVLHEFQRRYAEIQVDLSCADGRSFINAYLDSEPNHFDQDFHETFYRHTGGNALFISELLNGMKERGEVVQDKSGDWEQGPCVDWGQIPARVEAVIAERIDRLDSQSLTLLEVASVQGEAFSAALLAHVLGATEEEVTTRLSRQLCRQHRLVRCLSPDGQDSSHRASYQFCNILFQKYLYQGLDDVERLRLQRATANALERLC